MMAHTPGPWHVQPSDHPGGLLIKPIPGQVVAQCDEIPEMEANASLIAASPETTDCLQELVRGLKDMRRRNVIDLSDDGQWLTHWLERAAMALPRQVSHEEWNHDGHNQPRQHPRKDRGMIRGAEGNYQAPHDLRIARTSREAGQDHVPLVKTKPPRPWADAITDALVFAWMMAAIIFLICIFGGQS